MQNDSEKNLRENSVLLENKEYDNKIQIEIHDELILETPDGGLYAWLVVICSFLTQGITIGVINSYSVIHSSLQDEFIAQNLSDASSKAALVGSITFGTNLFMSPLVGVLSDRIGLSQTTFLGGILCTLAMLISSEFINQINVLYVTYGFLFGFGTALVATPSLVILGHYFNRHLGKANGIVTCGASVFTVVLPPFLLSLIKGHGLGMTLKVLAVLCLVLVGSSFVNKPIKKSGKIPNQKKQTILSLKDNVKNFIKSIIKIKIWRRKRYIIWSLCCALALCGYYVPYVHMVKIVRLYFPGQSETLPIMCIGITSGIGRLLCGILADMPNINRVYIHQTALAGIGILTALFSVNSSYGVLIIFTLLIGFFDGLFVSILSPIVQEFCGLEESTQALGFFFGLISVPITIGAPLAGIIYDATGSYTLPLILSGVPAVIGSGLMCCIRCVPDDEPEINLVVDKNQCDSEITMFQENPRSVSVTGLHNNSNKMSNDNSNQFFSTITSNQRKYRYSIL